MLNNENCSEENYNRAKRVYELSGCKNFKDYLDLYFCHRPDKNTPIEETVLAMNHLIQQGKVLYWGTSEWSAVEIMEAHRVAEKFRLIGPKMEQPQYNMFERTKLEKDYFTKYLFGEYLYKFVMDSMEYEYDANHDSEDKNYGLKLKQTAQSQNLLDDKIQLLTNLLKRIAPLISSKQINHIYKILDKYISKLRKLIK
jgi:hypothetical protein